MRQWTNGDNGLIDKTMELMDEKPVMRQWMKQWINRQDNGTNG